MNTDNDGWGDWVAHRLAAVRITEESYTEFKTKHGLMPTCNCPERREWLNEFGREFGRKKAKILRFLWRNR